MSKESQMGNVKHRLGAFAEIKTNREEPTVKLGIAPKCEFFIFCFFSSNLQSPLSPRWVKLKHIAPSSLLFFQPKQQQQCTMQSYTDQFCIYEDAMLEKYQKKFINSVQTRLVHKRQVHYATPACCQQPVLLAVYKGTCLWSHLFSLCISKRSIRTRK